MYCNAYIPVYLVILFVLLEITLVLGAVVVCGTVYRIQIHDCGRYNVTDKKSYVNINRVAWSIVVSVYG